MPNQSPHAQQNAAQSLIQSLNAGQTIPGLAPGQTFTGSPGGAAGGDVSHASR